MIPWCDFLNFFEGQTVHLAAPKTHFAQDIILPGDIPIFVMSIEMVEFVGKWNHVQIYCYPCYLCNLLCTADKSVNLKCHFLCYRYVMCSNYYVNGLATLVH